jgi:hypothetical protein
VKRSALLAAPVVACQKGRIMFIEEILKREFFIDNLLLRIHSFFDMIWWTGLTPWEFELTFPSSFLGTTR